MVAFEASFFYDVGHYADLEDWKTMNCYFIRNAVLLLTLLLIILMAIPAGALELVSEYSIPLKEKDRILGSLEGNYLVYGRPYVKMYNNRGKALFSKKLKNNVKPTLSPNGKYFGLITYADRSPTDLKTVKLEMFDQSGKFRWKIDKPAANAFLIADNGAFYGIEGTPGISPTKIHIYDQYGDRINILILDKYHGLSISPKGTKFIIDKARDGLEVYDSTGTLLDSLPVSKNYVIDRDERYIATFFQGIFRLYQDEKEVVSFKSPEMTIRDMAINVENNIVVLMAAKRLEVYELTTKKQLWEHRITDGSKWLNSLDLSNDARFIVCGLDVNGGNQLPKAERHVEGYLLLFTSNGKTMTRQKENYKIWGTGLPKGVFTTSSGSVLMQTREKLEKFRIK